MANFLYYFHIIICVQYDDDADDDRNRTIKTHEDECDKEDHLDAKH